MSIKIVTDSTADIPPQLAEELGITVVPLYVRFGEEVYRDRLEISEDEFYHRLANDPLHPGTTQPTPQDFAEAYRGLAKEADGILSIHLSSKMSGTHSSALQAKEMLKEECPIEVIDSQYVSMALGMIVIKAHELISSGMKLTELAEEVRQGIPTIRLLGFFDSLKYLALGGRIGKAKSMLGMALNVKPILTIKDGEFLPAGRVRTRAKGVETLIDFVKSASEIQDLIIVHSTTPDEAQALAERIDPIFPKERIMIARLGPVLGVHAGPGTLFIGIRETIKP